MANQVDTLRISKFTAEIGMALAQQGGMLRSSITYKGGMEVGKKAVVENLVGQVNATVIEGRFADVVPIDAPLTRRWYTPKRVGVALWADTFDNLITNIDLRGPYQTAMLDAMRREEDQNILKAAFGTSLTGEEGATSETFVEDTAGAGQNTVAESVGGANTGLSFAKLRAVREAMTRANVNLDQPVYMVISELDESALMAEQTGTAGAYIAMSGDYVNGTVYQTGKLPALMGFNFIKMSSATLALAGLYDGSHIYSLPVYVKSGLAMGAWDDLSIEMYALQRKWSTWEIKSEMTHGYTRLEPFKLMKVKTYY